MGVATVPELFAAALVILASAACVRGGQAQVVGGLALLMASLSRYEAWPTALAFSMTCLALAWRRPSQRRYAVTGAVLALAGVFGWLVWNRYAHGEFLHFFTRVAAYKRALGTYGEGSARLVAYPRLLLSEEPEVMALLFTGIVLRTSRSARDGLSPFARRSAVLARGNTQFPWPS